MQRIYTPLLVVLIMTIGILGITNPGFRQPYQLFDTTEGKLIHNYFIFSVYQQYNGFAVSADGKHVTCKRYIGIALNYFTLPSKREERP